MNKELKCYSLFGTFTCQSEEEMKKHEPEHALTWTPYLKYND